MAGKNKTQPKKECYKCKRLLNQKNSFYKTDSPLYPDGSFHICKECLLDIFDSDKGYDIAMMVLHSMDKPFIKDIWNKSDHAGTYIRQINSLPQYRNMNWSHSDFEESEKTDEGTPKKKKKKEHIDLDYMVSKWGSGYSNEEYQLFEKKYNALRDHYPEKTSMHTEALLTYIRYRTKEELATAEGRVKDAKEWGGLASKAATDAKINPSQLSQADLTDGLDTFGQLTRAVEQAEDIIEILPKFKEKPQDSVDFNIWQYINYARDLEGKSLIDYEDVYQFLEERKKEQEEAFNFTNNDKEDGSNA